MAYSLIISEAAETDIRDAFIWYEEQTNGLGEKFEKHIEAAIHSIVKNPLKTEIRYSKIRIFFLTKFPYGVHFSVTKNEVLIVAVLHTSRDPGRWRERDL